MQKSFQGQRSAAQQAALRRRQEPGAFGYAGNLYDCTSKSLDADKRGDLEMQGAGNVASVDERLVSLSPADFTQSGALTPPAEGAGAVYQGRAYLIKKALACEIVYGVPVNLPLIIYRAPAPDSAGDDNPAEQSASDAAAGEPDAPGATVVEKRKSYSPGPSNL